ncbi:class I SAM-dependent methyltransferase [Exilibacterium tricleocarpae]|uniref:Class I SAM-dependent methyltransferase n=1 Tax=Exilibacterium tricleocarpae TaxID=2591008 RepID=A0A545U6P5_9GAMM|nr:class I SAM-dependent methyltransferase [Exilibacterium tricleocarpae]TQV85150.1 class I SAM-dependent methyltransferase [Exilibacterium tricleocarpae]
MTDYSIKFWDRIAERYAKTPVSDEETYQKKLRVTQQYFRPHMQVLEFGCGTGSTALIHAPHVQHYHAIDASPKMIEIAERKLAQESIDNLSFDAVAMEDLAVEDQSLDAVLGLNILHLMDDWEKVVQHVYQILRPGGVFVSSTVCLGNTMHHFRFIAPIGKLFGLAPAVKIVTRQALEDTIKETGFAIEYKLNQEAKRLMSIFLIAKKPATKKN